MAIFAPPWAAITSGIRQCGSLTSTWTTTAPHWIRRTREPSVGYAAASETLGCNRTRGPIIERSRYGKFHPKS